MVLDKNSQGLSGKGFESNTGLIELKKLIAETKPAWWCRVLKPDTNGCERVGFENPTPRTDDDAYSAVIYYNSIIPVQVIQLYHLHRDY